jgi:peptide methionine sulfoxide reductase msrA/msrB
MKKLTLSLYALTLPFFLGLLSASAIDEATVHSEKIVLGSGCFWGAEKGYESLPGVIDAVSGYADGKGVRATYREITKLKNKFNSNNHAEVVEVTYNKNVISTEELLMHYFESHDPTQVNRQGNDIGTQYRSIILYSTEEQKEIINEVLSTFQGLLSAAGFGSIATLVKPIKNFYKAEKYHQDYIAKNPNGYCPDHSTGVKFAKKATVQAVDNSDLLSGKHIIVIEAEGYCPYCDKFRADVVKNYYGNIPLVFRLASQLQGLAIKSPTWATPTILFLENGKKLLVIKGILAPKNFMRPLATSSWEIRRLIK